MTMTVVEISGEVADRLHTATEPTPCQIADARMVVVDLLGGSPGLPLGLLVEQVAEAYVAPDGERLPIDLRGRDDLPVEHLRDEPALRHVLWVRATRSALRELTNADTVRWSRHTDDPDEVDHPRVEVLLTGGLTVAVIDVGGRLPDGSVSLA